MGAPRATLPVARFLSTAPPANNQFYHQLCPPPVCSAPRPPTTIWTCGMRHTMSNAPTANHHLDVWYGTHNEQRPDCQPPLGRVARQDTASTVGGVAATPFSLARIYCHHFRFHYGIYLCYVCYFLWVSIICVMDSELSTNWP